MKPVLYPIKETTFTTYGLGEIDATLCKVTRERNGLYTLYMEYPVNGRMATALVEGMKIKADAGVRTKWQTFEIVRVLKNSDNVIQIYAEHISQRTMKLALAPTVAVDGTAEQALRTWNANLIGGDSFDVWSDILTVNQTKWTIDKVKNARQALGGVEGSILDVWGGEYEFDNKMIRLHKKMGRTAPTVLEYGRNIISAEQEREISETYTSIVPYAIYTPQVESGQQSEPVIVTVDNYYIDSAHVDKYAIRTALPVDFSSEFDDKTRPTKEALQRLGADYIRKNKVGVPKVNTKVQYIDLASTIDYQQLKVLEEIELCDVVPIYFDLLDITNHDGKVIKIVFDVLKDENESIEVGEIGRTFVSTLGASFDTRISNIESQQKKFYSQTLPYLINSNGNRVWYSKPPNDIEHKIGDTWHEKNGLYRRLKIWNGADWEIIFDTEDMKSVERRIDELEKQSEQLQESIGDIDDLRKKINNTSVDNKLVTEIVGHDGKMKYSKNRLDLDLQPNELLTFEEGRLVIKHNGLGFIPGHEYTISFTMVERERPHSRVDIQTTVNASVTLVPQVNNRYPTKTGATHDKVYHDTYLVTITYPNKAPIVLTKQLQSDWSIRIDLHDLEPYISQRIVRAKIETKITNDNAIYVYGHHGVIRDCVKIGG